MDMDFNYCKHCGMGLDNDDDNYCNTCYDNLKPFLGIKYNKDKSTNIINLCDDMNLDFGVALCFTDCICSYLDNLYTKRYFDCIHNM